MNINQINDNIINCQKCSRLISYIDDVAQTKVKRYQQENYWGKPVPGFGDKNAQLLIIGLAPAAHGANRTGRMFTGDSSGDWLYRALYETGFANQPESFSMEDGLQLLDSYIVALAHCAPPRNKPSRDEILNCREHLLYHISAMKQAKVYLALGQMAFSNLCQIFELRGLKFAHNQEFNLSDGKKIITSYHPSRQNTQTGRLKWRDWLAVFQKIRSML